MDAHTRKVYVRMTETGFYILFCLQKPNHGYGVVQMVEKLTDGKSSYELVQTDSLTMTAGTYNHPERKPFAEQSREYKEDSARERIRQALRFGRPKGDR